jgi:hypothetical protein
MHSFWMAPLRYPSINDPDVPTFQTPKSTNQMIQKYFFNNFTEVMMVYDGVQEMRACHVEATRDKVLPSQHSPRVRGPRLLPPTPPDPPSSLSFPVPPMLTYAISSDCDCCTPIPMHEPSTIHIPMPIPLPPI